jgi:hypothetical protein
MDLTPLQELKRKLLHDKELAPVWKYFLDNLAEDQEFIDLGESTDHPFVTAVVAQVSRQLFPKAGPPACLMLTRLADQEFVHGGFIVANRPAGVIYFEDALMGLIAVAELPPSIETKYARFSGIPLRRGTPPMPSVN